MKHKLKGVLKCVKAEIWILAYHERQNQEISQVLKDSLNGTIAVLGHLNFIKYIDNSDIEIFDY